MPPFLGSMCFRLSNSCGCLDLSSNETRSLSGGCGASSRPIDTLRREICEKEETVSFFFRLLKDSFSMSRL
jgi:hypothetical protein